MNKMQKMIYHKAWTLLLLSALVGGATGRSAQLTKTQATEVAKISVQHLKGVKVSNYSWGWIRWMMNGQIDPGAAQTFGIVEIYAGQRNPLHYHPNAEEILYVLSGSCENIVGDRKMVLKAGDLVRIPPGIPHRAITLGKEPMRAVIVYNTSKRVAISLGPGKE
jgi:quercetin dioxygenase-like cupin family protein